MATRRPAHNTPIYMDSCMVSLKNHQVHVDRRVVGWSVGRHVDHPCGGQISSWPARKVTDFLRVPRCAVKTCSVHPVFARVVEELRAADPSKCPRAMKQNASPGEQFEAPRRRWKPGPEQHRGPEKTRTASTCRINPGMSGDALSARHFVRRDYHQRRKKEALSGGFLLIFLCFRPKRTTQKSAPNPGDQWYRRPQKHYIHKTSFGELFFSPGYNYNYKKNLARDLFCMCLRFPWKTYQYNYITNCLENYFPARLQWRLHDLFVCELFT